MKLFSLRIQTINIQIRSSLLWDESAVRAREWAHYRIEATHTESIEVVCDDDDDEAAWYMSALFIALEISVLSSSQSWGARVCVFKWFLPAIPRYHNFVAYLLRGVLQVQQRFAASLQEQPELVGLFLRLLVFLVACLLWRWCLIQQLLEDPRACCQNCLRKENSIKVDVGDRMIMTITFTAHTGSRVSPIRKVTSQSSGMDAKNLRSSASPDLFSKMEKSGSSAAAIGPSLVSTSGMACYLKVEQNEQTMSSEGQCAKDNHGECQQCQNELHPLCYAPWMRFSISLCSHTAGGLFTQQHGKRILVCGYLWTDDPFLSSLSFLCLLWIAFTNAQQECWWLCRQ
jgi:hypothetical protein